MAYTEGRYSSIHCQLLASNITRSLQKNVACQVSLYSTCADHSVNTFDGNNVGRSHTLQAPRKNIVSSPPLEFLTANHLLVPHRPRLKQFIYNKTPPLCGQIHDAAADIPTPARTNPTDVLLKRNPSSISATAAAAARVLSASCYYIAPQRSLQSATATCVCACRTSDSHAESSKSHIDNAAACICKFTATAFAESSSACSAFTTG